MLRPLLLRVVVANSAQELLLVSALGHHCSWLALQQSLSSSSGDLASGGNSNSANLPTP